MKAKVKKQDCHRPMMLPCSVVFMALDAADFGMDHGGEGYCARLEAGRGGAGGQLSGGWCGGQHAAAAAAGVVWCRIEGWRIGRGD